MSENLNVGTLAAASLGLLAGRMMGKGSSTVDAEALNAQLTSTVAVLNASNVELTEIRAQRATLQGIIADLESKPDMVNSIELAVTRDALKSAYDRVDFLTDYVKAKLAVDLSDVESYTVPITSGLHVDTSRVYESDKADPWLYSGPNGDIRARGITLVNGLAELRFLDSAGVQQITPLTSSLAKHNVVSQNVIAGKNSCISVFNPEAANLTANGLDNDGWMSKENADGKYNCPSWTLVEFDPSFDVIQFLATVRVKHSPKYLDNNAYRYDLAANHNTNKDTYSMSNVMIPVRRNVLLMQSAMVAGSHYNIASRICDVIFSAVGDNAFKIRSANLVHMPFNTVLTGFFHSDISNYAHTLWRKTPIPGKTFVL